MKLLTFKPTSQPLENELGISAFKVSINGVCESIIIVNDQLDEYLSLYKNGGYDLCVHRENAEVVAKLRALLPSMADIATRVRDHAKVTDLQGYSLTCWTGADGKSNYSINTPSGTGSDAFSFANVLYRTSDACKRGLPSSVGIGILQQAMTNSFRLQDPPIGNGTGWRAGFLP